MKTNKIVRAATVCFSLAMMTGYVVHSQLAQNRAVAPSSKSMILANPGKASGTNLAGQVLKTNAPLTIAPGSKSQAPLINVSPSSNPAQRTKSSMVFPGSKSAPVFPLEQPAPNKAGDTLETRKASK
jgi:hypothetical protein